MICHLIKLMPRATPSNEQLSLEILMRYMMGDKLIVIVERSRHTMKQPIIMEKQCL